VPVSQGDFPSGFESTRPFSLTPANLQPQPPAARGKTAFINDDFEMNEPSVFPLAADTDGTMPPVG
jgi:hypothetical protein